MYKFLDVVDKFLSPKHLKDKFLDVVDKFLSLEPPEQAPGPSGQVT